MSRNRFLNDLHSMRNPWSWDICVVSNTGWLAITSCCWKNNFSNFDRFRFWVGKLQRCRVCGIQQTYRRLLIICGALFRSSSRIFAWAAGILSGLYRNHGTFRPCRAPKRPTLVPRSEVRLLEKMDWRMGRLKKLLVVLARYLMSTQKSVLVVSVPSQPGTSFAIPLVL